MNGKIKRVKRKSGIRRHGREEARIKGWRKV